MFVNIVSHIPAQLGIHYQLRFSANFVFSKNGKCEMSTSFIKIVPKVPNLAQRFSAQISDKEKKIQTKKNYIALIIRSKK